MKKITLIFVIFFLFIGSAYSVDRGQITKDKINVRVDACVSAQSLGRLDKGENVQLFEERFDWYKIRLPKQFTAYAARQFIERKNERQGKVKASSLNLRSAPSLSAPIIGAVDCGQVVYIVGEEKDWLEVKAYPYSYGWVHRRFIRPQGTEEKNEVKFILQTIRPLSLSPCLPGVEPQFTSFVKEEVLTAPAPGSLPQAEPDAEQVPPAPGQEIVGEEKVSEAALTKEDAVTPGQSVRDNKTHHLSSPPQSFAESLIFLSSPSLEEKKPVHALLVEMGPVIVPRLEEALIDADINTTYSIIDILGRIGQGYPEIAQGFLRKIDKNPSFLAAVYLDIVQDIVAPPGVRTSYLETLRQNRLTDKDIKKAKHFLYEAYRQRFKLFTRKDAAGADSGE